MRALIVVLTLGFTFVTAGCYSNDTKESGSDSTEQSAPTPSRSGRY